MKFLVFVAQYFSILERVIFRSTFFFHADLPPPCGNNSFRIKTDFQLLPKGGFLIGHEIKKNLVTVHKLNNISAS